MPVEAVVTFSNPHGVSWRKGSPPNVNTVEPHSGQVLECKKQTKKHDEKQELRSREPSQAWQISSPATADCPFKGEPA